MDYAISPARASKLVDEVVVSTDSQHYAEVAAKLGARVPFLRPRELAKDVPTEQVLIHAVNWLSEHKDYQIDHVVLLQCTSPLSLKTEYIDACIRAVVEGKGEVDSSMTVCEISEHPEWIFKVGDDGLLKPFMDVPLKGEWGVRQSLEKLYRPTGACYVTSYHTLMKKSRIIGDRCKGIVVPKELGIDIDEERDFKLAEEMLKEK